MTISLDEDLARWARVRAAECDTSLSQLLGDVLRAEMEKDAAAERDDYHQAMRRFFAIKPKRLRAPGERLPTREQMHER